MTHSSYRNRFARQRRGNMTYLVVGFLFALVAIGGVVYWTMFRDDQNAVAGPILNEVSNGPYDFIVLEQGEVESASAKELRCEVKSRSAGGSGGGGTTIIWVIPEGSLVKGPPRDAEGNVLKDKDGNDLKGELLVTLDARSLELERVQQQITVNTSESLVTQAKNTLKAANIARIEYLEGTFRNEERSIKGEVFVAAQAVRTAQLGLESAERLGSKGLITPLQLEGLQFAVQKAQNDLDNANGKLNVLHKYTKEKMLTQFDSDIKTAETKVKNEENSHKLELDKLKDISDQIGKCTITAPQDGQVVYVNKYNTGRSGSSAEFVVEAGAQVREQQPILKIPTSNAMQIKALINEARVTLVRKGQPVTIRVDALKDELIEGEVDKVNQYAEPAGWGGGNIKKYAAYITVKSSPVGLRSGMNAEVRIHIERRPEALQIPVQALAEHRGKYFVVLKKGESFETAEVHVGSTNDKTAVIEKGLQMGDQVVMNPRSSSMLVLPDLPEPTIVKEVKLDPAAATALANPGPSKGAAPSPPPGGDSSPGVGGAPVAREGGKSRGGPGGPGGGKGGPAGGRRNFSPEAMIARTMENDADKDGKLSMAELEAIDERFRQRVVEADTNKDGFVDQEELTVSTNAMIKRMQEGGFGGGGSGGPPGGGPGGGQ